MKMGTDGRGGPLTAATIKPRVSYLRVCVYMGAASGFPVTKLHGHILANKSTAVESAPRKLGVRLPCMGGMKTV